MKVDTIKEISFKGLFLDKSRENGGNWRMEYRPYSWEGNMAKKVQLDIASGMLPDNEEIFISEGGREHSKDILGTISYYKDVANGNDVKRSTITELSSMNLENSLKIRDRKYNAFLQLKQDEMNRIKNEILRRREKVPDTIGDHRYYTNDVRRGFGSHFCSKEERACGIERSFNKIVKISEDNTKDFRKYSEIAESAETIRKAREFGREELAKIEYAKMTNSFIDISRRDIENPNAPLLKALEDLTSIKGKRIALSHRTITFEEIVKNIGKEFRPEKAIEFVEYLMQRRL